MLSWTSVMPQRYGAVHVLARMLLHIVVVHALPSASFRTHRRSTANDGCGGEIFPSAADPLYAYDPPLEEAARPPRAAQVDRLAISLQEFVSWEQTVVTKWSHVRKLLVQHQGEDFWDLWKSDNEARELVTLSRLWQELRIGQSRRRIARPPHDTLAYEQTSVEPPEHDAPCLLGELSLLLSTFLFLPRSELRSVVNETRGHFFLNSQLPPQQFLAPPQHAFFFSPAFFDRQRADKIGHNANVLVEVLERLVVGATTSGVQEQEIVPPPSEGTTSTATFDWAEIALGGSPSTGTNNKFLSAASSVWPVFALLSSIFSRAASGQTGEHHMQRITYGMYGFHHHGTSGATGPASAFPAASQTNESFWPTWQELYTGIVKEEEERELRLEGNNGKGQKGELLRVQVDGNPMQVQKGKAKTEAEAEGESDDSFRETRCFFQHEIQEWMYHPALTLSNPAAGESLEYCNRHYKYRELDLTLSRITSEGLLFGRYRSEEDLRRCLVFSLLHLANLALRLKQQHEVEDHLFSDREERVDDVVEIVSRRPEVITQPEEEEEVEEDSSWYGDVAGILAFIRSQVAAYFWLLFDKWMLWELLAHFGLHQVVQIHALPQIFPLLVTDREVEKEGEPVEHVYSPSIPPPARSEVLRLGRKFVGRFHWSQRLELYFRSTMGNDGGGAEKSTGTSGFSPSTTTSSSSYLQVIYPRYLTFNGVVSSALRAKQTPYCPREFQDVLLKIVVDRDSGSSPVVEVIEVGPHLGDCMFWSRVFLGRFFAREKLRIRGVDIDQQVVEKLRKSILLNKWQREVSVKLAAITEEQEDSVMAASLTESSSARSGNGSGKRKHAYTHTLDEIYMPRTRGNRMNGSAIIRPPDDSFHRSSSSSAISVLKIHVVGRLEHQILYGASRLLASRIDYVVLHTDYPHVLRNSARFLMLPPGGAFRVGQVLLKGLTWDEYVQLRRLYHQSIVQLLEGSAVLVKTTEDADEAAVHGLLLDRMAAAVGTGGKSASPSRNAVEFAELQAATQNFVATERTLARRMAGRGTRSRSAAHLPEKTEWYLSLHPWFLSDRLMHYFFFSLEVRQVLFAKEAEKALS